MTTPAPSDSSSFWAREPAVAVSLVTTLLSLAASFGFALNQQQTTTIVAAVFAAVSLIAGFAVRAKVSAPATVVKIQADAQAAVAAAQADKANIIAAIGTASAPVRSKVPAVPDPVPVITAPSDADVLASVEPTVITQPSL